MTAAAPRHLGTGAVDGFAPQAAFACPAAGNQTGDHPIADGDGTYRRSDGLDDTHRLVTEHEGTRAYEGPVEIMQIAVTQSARLDADEYLVRAGRIHLDRLDHEIGCSVGEYRRGDQGHARLLH